MKGHLLVLLLVCSGCKTLHIRHESPYLASDLFLSSLEQISESQQVRFNLTIFSGKKSNTFQTVLEITDSTIAMVALNPLGGRAFWCVYEAATFRQGGALASRIHMGVKPLFVDVLFTLCNYSPASAQWSVRDASLELDRTLYYNGDVMTQIVQNQNPFNLTVKNYHYHYTVKLDSISKGVLR